MALKISIEQVDNGFIFTSFDDQAGEAKTSVHESARQVVGTLRSLFGLKPQGRPVQSETKVFDPFAADEPVED